VRCILPCGRAKKQAKSSNRGMPTSSALHKLQHRTAC
jgi:hypothetical protein